MPWPKLDPVMGRPMIVGIGWRLWSVPGGPGGIDNSMKAVIARSRLVLRIGDG